MCDAWNIAQSIATIGAAVLAIPMIYLATRQLRLAAGAYKAAADQSTIAAKAASLAAMASLKDASRELQWKVIEDRALRSILVPDLTPDSFNDEIKRALVRGMLISQYAFVYDFHILGLLPESTWKGYVADMHEFFSNKDNQDRWKDLKEYYPKEFQAFVDGNLLRRPN